MATGSDESPQDGSSAGLPGPWSDWAQAGAPQSGPGPARPPVNDFAIGALVTGLFGIVPLTVGLAITAFVQARRHGERGLGLAVGGLLAATIWTTLAIMVIGHGVRLGEEGRSGGSSASGLKVGQCIAKFDATSLSAVRLSSVPPVPCTLPHAAQAVAAFDLQVDHVPVIEEIQRLGGDGCRDRLGINVLKHPRAVEPGLRLGISYPSPGAWEAGDHQILCMVVARQGALAESIDLSPASLDPHRKSWAELDRGDCVRESPRSDQLVVWTTVDCQVPHYAQVVDKYTESNPPPLTFAGQDDLLKRFADTCEKRVNAILARRPPSRDLLIVALGPPEELWVDGQRTVTCVVTPLRGRLHESALPR